MNMYCPEHLILDTKNIMIWFYDSADIPWHLIPLKRKLNPLRYQVTFKFGTYPNNKNYRLNKEGSWNLLFSNFLYRHIRPKLCKWLGIHQHMSFRGGKNYCHHCNLGKDK